jgi:hypothetical protein
MPDGETFRFPIHAALAGYPIWVGDWPNGELCNVAVALTDWLECLPPMPDEPEVTTQTSTPLSTQFRPITFKPARRRRGGAPPRYDWDAFWAEVVRYAIRNGLHPDGRRGLQQHLEDWTAERWDPPPEASTLRRRMMRLYGKLGRTPGAAPEEVSADPVHAADWDAFWIEVTRYVAVNGLGRRQDLRRHLLQWMEQRWRAPLKQAGVSSRIACLYTARPAEMQEGGRTSPQ